MERRMESKSFVNFMLCYDPKVLLHRKGRKHVSLHFMNTSKKHNLFRYLCGCAVIHKGTEVFTEKFLMAYGGYAATLERSCEKWPFKHHNNNKKGKLLRELVIVDWQPFVTLGEAASEEEEEEEEEEEGDRLVDGDIFTRAQICVYQLIEKVHIHLLIPILQDFVLFDSLTIVGGFVRRTI
uniref:Uncharacterized protein n=1 Tax=Glossina austeni TaxID=7395 RepID=A0A1A9VUT1_GLOAU